MTRSLWNITIKKEERVKKYITTLQEPDTNEHKPRFEKIKKEALRQKTSNDKLKKIGYQGTEKGRHKQPLIYDWCTEKEKVR